MTTLILYVIVIALLIWSIQGARESRRTLRKLEHILKELKVPKEEIKGIYDQAFADWKKTDMSESWVSYARKRGVYK